MTRAEARVILESMTKSASLLRHMRTVELVMEQYAVVLGEDVEKWAIAGLLHDADYEAYPDKHPAVIVEKLNKLGATDIAHAISAHYTRWGVPYESRLDKALLACDELTGFIIACCQVRPDGISSLQTSSVVKKLKDKRFAASVDREEIHRGCELFQVELSEHISFIIKVLTENRTELGIG